MTKNVSIYNLSTSEVDEKYLEASQQLQLDKQNYGSDYIHLYVDDIEGDWLENWDWEDDLTDYIDAFYHHCEQGNYQFAFDTLKACDDLWNQPENHEKCLELYSYLVERLELQNTKQPEINHQEILNLAKQQILVLQNNEQGENMSEQMIFKMNEEKITRLEYIQKLLEKIYNGVIRKTWKFQDKFRRESSPYVYNLRGMASAGDCVVEFGVSQDFDNFNYYLNKKSASNPEEEIVNESHYYECDNSNYSYQEFKLIQEYLEKIEKASWQVKLSDLDTLPE
ncbi:MAG: hypothetical protein AN481_12440 [Aphanizomenon flos-aquae LD13]|jgi:hypothetical protein|uniref:Uncharacterized protein n=1 Tax=Aphanizomenon flos-aquae LD13 TaxID=1710894 RepID=A0A1B7VVS6_APHFL|nr:hypothetical protein [Aphanizomenon flos-aquae UKL13-PB]OBQ25019.1 MAG: hypothetical protein AN481_12440 [Aphanizomenon flos-aquae LD13]HCQ20155.1 hypothetical protein [Anabaena sp. UBA12330]